ncbi:peptide/nickel transport system substrate-binding protein [Microbacterium endophyticum]|uniref:Peptide/nickel transport system substrate-binding protein n=1 Tax=Microbacterium endophyticum TaxID=1526412 RepID=A0A7W4YNI3_9MICO|nr:ABC transporter substrate-binding protein [Microbacterium endophyticum]MBB2976614.1 peptide/nickel transport system substrate-binding protein [Microbacterium endophyticum]NIK37503.1 peptide/nickel transport system substrate-binding protein [Microbacterium endophyticum]
MRTIVRICLAASVATALIATSACSAGGEATGGERNETLIYGKSDGGTTYVRNYNVLGPATEKAPNSELIYEPLARIDYSDGAVVVPWLAESMEFDETGEHLTIVIRDDVTFSDGEALTADDVAYSLSLPIDNPDLNLAGITYSSVEIIDDATVQVDFDAPSFAALNQFTSASLPMVPEHIWKDQDLTTWTNPDPVGTGPFTLDAFAPQQVTLKARDDYWGGQMPMKYYKILATSGEAVKAQLLRGDIDWAPAGWPDAEEEFVAKDPENNIYQLYATGGAYSMMYNTAQAPFDDVNLRRAFALSIPRSDITATLNRPGTEAGPTGLVDQIYGDWIAPEYRDVVQEVDASSAQAALAASGYEVVDGALVKDGQSYTPKLSFNQDFGWNAYADIMINSWKEVLGVTVTPSGAPSATLYDQQKTGEFDMTIATTGGAGVYGLYSFLDSRYVEPLGTAAATNIGRWDDAETDAVLGEMAQTSDEATMKELGMQMQQIVVDEVPFSPIYNSYWFVDVNASLWKGWPTPDDFDAVPFPSLGPDTILTLLSLTPAS